ncbi:MAG: hypothetical protein R2857_11045 [Vampirovibrionales bacterium]
MANAFLAQNNINRANDYTLANLLPRFTDPTAANFISPETLLYQYQTYLNGGVTPDGVANPDQALYNQLSPYFNELNVYLSGSRYCPTPSRHQHLEPAADQHRTKRVCHVQHRPKFSAPERRKPERHGTAEKQQHPHGALLCRSSTPAG